MTRYVCLINEEALARFRNAVANGRVACNYPEKYVEYFDDGRNVPEGMLPIHRFDAPDRESADRYFDRMRTEGCPTHWNVIGSASGGDVSDAKPWRFRDCLHQARVRLDGVEFPDGTDRIVRSNEQFRTVTRLLGQACELYHRSRREAGVAILSPQDRHGVGDSLRKAEQAIAILALMLDAACDAIGPAYAAFGIERHRRFRLAIDDPGQAPAQPASPDQTPTTTKRPKQAVAAGVK